jgi:hypothetical protein
LRLKSENADIARKAWQALAISQDVWESYCCDFGGVTKYVDCLRFHDLFGLKRAQELKGETLRKELPQMFQYSQSIERAMELMNTAGTLYEKSGKPGNQAFFDDIMLQTEVYNIFFKSRVKMVQAFISIDNKDADLARTQFEEMKSLDKELVHAVLKKPNISDDFEFEGMSTPIHIPPRVNGEIKAIDSLLASFKTQ